MKKKQLFPPLITLVLFSFLFQSCSNESLKKEVDPDGSGVFLKSTDGLPNMVTLISKEDIETGKANTKIESYLKNWKDYIRLAMEDKGLIELNKHGLFLLGYEELKNDKEILEQIISNPLRKTSYIPVYPIHHEDSLNEFVIKQPFKDVDDNFRSYKMEKQNFKKKLDFKLDNFGEPFTELQAIRLTWKYNGEIFYTVAIISREKLIYDEILSNLRETNYSQKTTEHDFSKNKNSDGNNCFPFNVSYSDRLDLTTEHYFGVGAFAWAEISVFGDQISSTCTRYIQSKSSNTGGNYSSGYSHDASVKIISFEVAGRGNDGGHCDYMLGVAVGYSFFSGVSLTWNGSGFSLNGGGSGQLRERGSYVTPEMLE